MNNNASELNPTSALMTFVRSEQGKQWLFPLLVFVISRLLVIACLVFGATFLPESFDDDFPEPYMTEGFPAYWMRWDSIHYLMIVEEGYTVRQDDGLSRVSFFPVYPMLIKALSPVLVNPLVAGLVISNVCFYLALVLLYRLALMETGQEAVAARAVIYISIFPTTLFFSAVYTESLSLLLVLLTVIAAREQKWGLAALAGLVATGTRIPNLALVVLVGMEWLASHGWMWVKLFERESWNTLWQAIRTDFGNLLKICAIPVGMLIYMGYLYLEFGSPFTFVQSTFTDERRMRDPITGIVGNIIDAFNGEYAYAYNLPYDLLFLVVLLLMLVPIARRLRGSYAVYCVVALLPALFSGTTRSLTRYIMVLFPFIILLAIYGENRWVHLLIRAIFIPLACVLTVLYGMWLFVG